MASKTIQGATKIRIYPDKEQGVLLAKHFGCARFVYNYFLDLKKNTYEETGKSPGLYECSRLLTQLKKQPEYTWLNEIDSQSSKAVLKDLDNAFSKFFKKTGRYPRFKSKKDNSHSYRATQCISINIENNTLKVPKFSKPFKFRGTIKDGLIKINSCTISKTPSGKYFASIQGVFEMETLASTGEIIGIDLGIKNLLVDSNGKTYENKQFLERSLKKIQYLSRQLSKKQKGSKNREKARQKLAIQHETISLKRKDYLHKVSCALVRENQTICMENPCTAEIVVSKKFRRISRKLYDVSWGMFKDFVRYKSELHDRELIIIPRLQERTEKNIDSAKRILLEGLKELSVCRQ